jgi:hypothetical protein
VCPGACARALDLDTHAWPVARSQVTGHCEEIARDCLWSLVNQLLFGKRRAACVWQKAIKQLHKKEKGNGNCNLQLFRVCVPTYL